LAFIDINEIFCVETFSVKNRLANFGFEIMIASDLRINWAVTTADAANLCAKFIKEAIDIITDIATLLSY
jgi:hypothetical protein